MVKVSRNYRMSGQNEQNLPRRAAGLVSRRAVVGDTLGLADGAHAFCKPLTETEALLRAPRRICASRTQRGAGKGEGAGNVSEAGDLTVPNLFFARSEHGQPFRQSELCAHRYRGQIGQAALRAEGCQSVK